MTPAYVLTRGAAGDLAENIRYTHDERMDILARLKERLD